MVMESRLNEFNLEVAPEKTKQLEFGPFAQSKAKARGERAQTFNFLISVPFFFILVGSI